jgi:hypothetical protein
MEGVGWICLTLDEGQLQAIANMVISVPRLYSVRWRANELMIWKEVVVPGGTEVHVIHEKPLNTQSPS